MLLGRKKRGLGEGLFVGLGGKFEAGETERLDAVSRDRGGVGARVDPADLDRRGDLFYSVPRPRAVEPASTVFVVTRWEGEASPSDELDPVWFDIVDLPLDEMWDDARPGCPECSIGGHVSREFVFASDLSTVSSDRPVGPVAP